jgi:hypothetical protein
MFSSDNEYQSLRSFLSWTCDNGGIPFEIRPEAHPMWILDREERANLAGVEGAFSFAQLKMALKETINDTLPNFSRWSVSQIEAADAALREAGTPTLSEMLLLFSKDLRRIEKRGRIESEDEALFVRNALATIRAAQKNCARCYIGMNLAKGTKRNKREVTLVIFVEDVTYVSSM